MKRILLCILTIVAMVSCTKKNITLIEEPQEISYQTVVGTLHTKAATAFNTDYVFQSFAINHENIIEEFYLPSDKLNDKANWIDAGEIANYLQDETISYDGTNKWKAATTFYWPKASYLTFYAWTTCTDNCVIDGLGAGTNCYNTTGITVNNYTINSTSNFNKDFMVAEVAYNQTSNTHNYGSWQQGVPTVFHHQLSSFKFKAKTKENYGTQHELYLSKIEFKDVQCIGSYSQLEKASSIPYSTWTLETDVCDYPMITAGTSNGAVDIPGLTDTKGIKLNNTLTALSPNSTDFTILLPQELENATVELTFTWVETINSTIVTKTETISKNLKDIFEYWLQEHQYTLTLNFALDEILWDPATEVWTEESLEASI